MRWEFIIESRAVETPPCRSRARIDRYSDIDLPSDRDQPSLTCVRKRGCKKIFRESRLSKVLARIKAVCSLFINIAELEDLTRDHHRLSFKLALNLHFFFYISSTLVYRDEKYCTDMQPLSIIDIHLFQIWHAVWLCNLGFFLFLVFLYDWKYPLKNIVWSIVAWLWYTNDLCLIFLHDISSYLR